MGLAVLLVVVGIADLAPARWDRRGVVTGLGVLALVLGALATRDGARAWWALAVAAVGFLGWRLGVRAAARATTSTVSAARARALALGALGLALVALVLAGRPPGPWASPEGSPWRGPVGPAGTLLDAVRLPGTLLALGVLLVQVSTANRVVRLVLDAVGVPAARNEQSLRGGRVLGPLERLLVVGLGLAGQLGAAAVVVAAKGLLRYPELQAAKHDKGPTDVSEYFLIGSFVSWLLAIGGALLVLGAAAAGPVLGLG
jgi:hypothetical protein